jgi:ABC-type uncharacterized transport system auxiliary subunit
MLPRSGDEVRVFGAQPTGVAATLLSLLLLSACTSLNKPYPAKETFSFTTPAIAKSPQRHDAVLRVERVVIAAPFDSPSFVYRLSESKYEPDYYREFVASPERLFTAEIVRSLAGANAFTTVIEPGAGIDAKLRLATTISELYADFRDKSAPHAVIRARFLLIEERLESTVVIGEWTLESRKPTAPPTSSEPAALAEAWGRTWGDVMNQLVQALAK